MQESKSTHFPPPGFPNSGNESRLLHKFARNGILTLIFYTIPAESDALPPPEKQKEGDRVRCPKCGTENKASAKRCVSCGRSFASPQKKGWIAVIAAAVLVVAALVAVLTNLTRIRNLWIRNFASPEEYYVHVESEAAKELSGDLAEAYENWIHTAPGPENMRRETDLHIDVYRAGREFLEAYTGDDYAWLSSVDLPSDISWVRTDLYGTATLFVNGKTLVDTFTREDAADLEMRSLSPQISDRVARYSGADLLKPYADPGEVAADLSGRWLLQSRLPTQQSMSGSAYALMDMAFSAPSTAERGQDTLAAQGVSSAYTTLTVRLPETEMRMLALDLRKAFFADETLQAVMDYVSPIGMTVGNGILRLLDRLAGDAVMTVWVDDGGAIRGRQLIVDGTELFYFAAPRQGDRFGFEARLWTDLCTYRISGSGEEKEEKITGSFSIEAGEVPYGSFETREFDVGALKHGRLSGGLSLIFTREFYSDVGFYSLSSRYMEDMSYALEFDGTAEHLKLELRAYKTGEPFGTLDLDTRLSANGSIGDIGYGDSAGDWLQDAMDNGKVKAFEDELYASDIPGVILNKYVMGFIERIRLMYSMR